MDPSAATAAAMGIQYDMASGMAFGDPSMQQQHDGRISYDASDAQMMQQLYPHQFNQHSMPSALLGRKHAPDRRPLRFWQPFNDWWRSELNRLGRRPTSEEIGEWYIEAADTTWGETKPTLQETRVHAKCLRSLPLVRDYFRNYRAKKKAKGSDGSGYDEDTGDGDTEDGTDNGGSSRRQKTGAKRARLGGPSNSNPETAGTSGLGRGSGGGVNSDPGAAGLVGAGGYAGLDLLQAYQPQYWEAAQNEEYARQAMLQHMQQVALYQQLAAQQLTGGDIQYAVLQQQQQALDEADPLNAAAAAAAVAAAKAAGHLPEGGGEPVSGAAGDDEHIDHEPLYDMGDTQHRPRRPADTATSNAAVQGDAITEEAVSQQMRDKSASVSRGRTPQHDGSPESEPAAGAAGDGADSSAQRAVALQQQQRQQLHLGSNSGELQLQSGSEQQGQELDDQDAGPMDAADAAGEPVAEASAAAPVRSAVIKAEDTGMDLGDSHMPEPAAGQQQQHGQPQAQEEQQQPQSASKLRQQLDLGDAAAHQDAGAATAGTGADKASRPPQQQQQEVKKPLAQSDLQAALFSAAAAAAQGAGVSAAAAAAAHGSTAVSPYIQGISAAAAAAAAAGGLNLADSPQVRPAVEQEEPHPGAQLPEAAAAALAATPATTGHRTSAVGEHRADTPGADHGRGISIDVDEAELLNDVEMGGMSHGELVAHIRTVQQELLSKRGLLSRSFEQLRRVQDRLARRERKLAKEQQKCKQYQSAVETWQAAWQAAALPAMDAAAQEGDHGQAGPAQGAHAAAAALADAAAAAAEPQQ